MVTQRTKDPQTCLTTPHSPASGFSFRGGDGGGHSTEEVSPPPSDVSPPPMNPPPTWTQSPPCLNFFPLRGQLYYLNPSYFSTFGLNLYRKFFKNLCITIYIHDKPLLDTLLINLFVATESRAIPPPSGPSPPLESPP